MSNKPTLANLFGFAVAAAASRCTPAHADNQDRSRARRSRYPAANTLHADLRARRGSAVLNPQLPAIPTSWPARR